MTYEVKEGTGTLFKNSRKARPEQPDCTGQTRYNGVLLRIAGWKRKTKSGEDYLSLRFTPDERDSKAPPMSAPAPARAAPAVQASPQRTAEVFETDADIPF
jgi:hypothetical protein